MRALPETARSDTQIATELDAGAAVSQASARPAGILIGYARCSTEKQDLTAQRQILQELGVTEDRVYLDHGLTGTNRSRPGLNNALAALREGDTLVVPKLDRLARSVPDARAIGDSLAARGVRLSLGGSVYDPSDPMGKCFFNILATFAEFEVDLLRMRTREGMAIARAKGRLKGKAPKLSPTQRTVLLKLHGAGEHSIAELAELFSSAAPPSTAKSHARPPKSPSLAFVERSHLRRRLHQRGSLRRAAIPARLIEWRNQAEAAGKRPRPGSLPAPLRCARPLDLAAAQSLPGCAVGTRRHESEGGGPAGTGLLEAVQSVGG